MADGPDKHQLENRDLRQVQQDIQNQFDEKRELQRRAEQLVKYVLVPFGTLLPILALILWIESGTVLELFSLRSLTRLITDLTTETFLQDYHSELILAVAIFGTFSLLAHTIYSVFVKFFPMAIELISSAEMRSGVKPSRYAALNSDTTDKKAEQLLLLDLISALEHNQEILNNLQTQFDESVQYLQNGVTLLVGSLLVIFVPLITQSSLGFVVGSAGAAVVGSLLLLNEVSLANYGDLLVHDPKTDLAIAVAVLAILPLSLFPAAPLILLGPLIVVVILSGAGVLWFAIHVDLDARLAIAIRTLIFTVIALVKHVVDF
ncbi:hypothetical protein SAMN05216388_10411 [Halorientalis persicus]|uniref:Uncharacterized protein n=1 Tax=Halorientalis persicus TaxID=1367881 RepID=A0A1H8VRF5_9EURY|nr:hypothetical protein [Halorientalis persicus]SEP17904.1 hypothetical protein SAMN05216388_10411 [Halorientalis persicus]